MRSNEQKPCSKLNRRNLFALSATAPVLAIPFVGSAQAQTANESTFDRIMRTRKIRVAGIPGELPFFNRDIVSGKWSGACVEMAQNIADELGGMELEWLESTYGNSVLQLQSGKIDLAFALTCTPKRALAIDFTDAMFDHGIGMCSKPDFKAQTWEELNDPSVKMGVELGSSMEAAARRFAAKADITSFRNRDDVVLALASGRTQCAIFSVLIALTAMQKNPAVGEFTVLQNPFVSQPSTLGVPKESDLRWRDFLNVWIRYNRGSGQIREWFSNGLKLAGIDSIPPNVEF